MTVFADLGDFEEDDRINVIGRAAQQGALVGFIVDADAKADRYIDKLVQRFRIRVIDRQVGPVEDMILVRVGPIGELRHEHR